MMDNLDRQQHLEHIYSKSNIDNIVLREIDIKGKDYLDSALCLATIPNIDFFKANECLWIELLSDSQDKHIQTIGTKIGARMGLTGIKAIGLGSEILEKAVDVGIYDINIYENSKIVVPNISLDSDTKSAIDRLMYQPPMVCEPNPWKRNNDGGWLSFDKHIVLGTGNKHFEYQCYDVLNTLQSIPWEIDQDILFKFINEDAYKADVEIFVDYLEKPFYFVWRYDKRGRMYSEGYNINLQSNEFRKAMINFADKEVVTL